MNYFPRCESGSVAQRVGVFIAFSKNWTRYHAAECHWIFNAALRRAWLYPRPTRKRKVVIDQALDQHCNKILNSEGTRRQILICCPRNDAVNSQCRRAHTTFPRQETTRAHLYSTELQHVEAILNANPGQNHTKQAHWYQNSKPSRPSSHSVLDRFTIPYFLQSHDYDGNQQQPLSTLTLLLLSLNSDYKSRLW